jgi:hypothetical protein
MYNKEDIELIKEKNEYYKALLEYNNTYISMRKKANAFLSNNKNREKVFNIH